MVILRTDVMNKESVTIDDGLDGLYTIEFEPTPAELKPVRGTQSKIVFKNLFHLVYFEIITMLMVACTVVIEKDVFDFTNFTVIEITN